MISYSTLGTRDMQRSIRFYDPVFAALGGTRTTTSETWTGYGRKGDRALFFLTQTLKVDGSTCRVQSHRLTS